MLGGSFDCDSPSVRRERLPRPTSQTAASSHCQIEVKKKKKKKNRKLPTSFHSQYKFIYYMLHLLLFQIRFRGGRPCDPAERLQGLYERPAKEALVPRELPPLQEFGLRVERSQAIRGAHGTREAREDQLRQQHRESQEGSARRTQRKSRRIAEGPELHRGNNCVPRLENRILTVSIV